MGRVEEIEHTADRAIRVEAESLDDLLATAVIGMFAVIGRLAANGRRERRHELEVRGDDDTRLRDLLRAALGLFDRDASFVTAVEIDGARATLRAVPFDPSRDEFHTEIKGVTWHGLHVRERAGRWTAEIVFDV